MLSRGSGGATFSGTKAYRTEMSHPSDVAITKDLTPGGYGGYIVFLRAVTASGDVEEAGQYSLTTTR